MSSKISKQAKKRQVTSDTNEGDNESDSVENEGIINSINTVKVNPPSAVQDMFKKALLDQQAQLGSLANDMRNLQGQVRSEINRLPTHTTLTELEERLKSFLLALFKTEPNNKDTFALNREEKKQHHFNTVTVTPSKHPTLDAISTVMDSTQKPATPLSQGTGPSQRISSIFTSTPMSSIPSIITVTPSVVISQSIRTNDTSTQMEDLNTSSQISPLSKGRRAAMDDKWKLPRKVDSPTLPLPENMEDTRIYRRYKTTVFSLVNSTARFQGMLTNTIAHSWETYKKNNTKYMYDIVLLQQSFLRETLKLCNWLLDTLPEEVGMDLRDHLQASLKHTGKRLSFEQEVIDEYTNHSYDPYELMKQIEDIYIRRNPLLISEYRGQLNSLEMDPSMDPEVYIREYTAIHNDAVVNCPGFKAYTDKEMVDDYIDALPNSEIYMQMYMDLLKTANKEQRDITLKEIQDMLRSMWHYRTAKRRRATNRQEEIQSAKCVTPDTESPRQDESEQQYNEVTGPLLESSDMPLRLNESLDHDDSEFPSTNAMSNRTSHSDEGNYPNIGFRSRRKRRDQFGLPNRIESSTYRRRESRNRSAIPGRPSIDGTRTSPVFAYDIGESDEDNAHEQSAVYDAL
jgi:hypothetical protein